MINTFIWLALGTGAVLYGVSLYKNLQGLRTEVTRAWQHVDALLQQRHEDSPVLVTACRPFPKFEREALEKLLEARRSAESARVAGDVEALGCAGQHLRRSVLRIAATVEGCPELKAHPSLRQLLARLNSLENALADRREVYNRCVRRHNERLHQFPELVVARLGRFRPAPLLEGPETVPGSAGAAAWQRAERSA